MSRLYPCVNCTEDGYCKRERKSPVEVQDEP